MKTVRQSKFEQELIESTSSIVIAYFWSSHCPTCSMVDPLMLELENNYKDKIKILKIDGEKELKLVETFTVDSVPTFVIFSNESGEIKVIDTIKGFKKKFELEKIIRTHLR